MKSIIIPILIILISCDTYYPDRTDFWQQSDVENEYCRVISGSIHTNKVEYEISNPYHRSSILIIRALPVEKAKIEVYSLLNSVSI